MCVLEMQNLYVLAFLLIKNVEKYFFEQHKSGKSLAIFSIMVIF